MTDPIDNEVLTKRVTSICLDSSVSPRDRAKAATSYLATTIFVDMGMAPPTPEDMAEAMKALDEMAPAEQTLEVLEGAE